MISLDTSVIVRYLVGTPDDQARRATALIEESSTVGISTIALLECSHVLRTQYGIPRRDVLDTLIQLLTRDNVSVLGLLKADTLQALVTARSLPGSPLPDALIAATSRSAGALPVYTFDEDFRRLGVAVQLV